MLSLYNCDGMGLGQYLLTQLLLAEFVFFHVFVDHLLLFKLVLEPLLSGLVVMLSAFATKNVPCLMIANDGADS